MKDVNRRAFLKRAGAASVGLAVWGNASSEASPPTHASRGADAWLEIDLNHIGWNLAQIRRRVNNRPVMAVIKANAYGHGLVEVGKALEKQQISYLAVGKVQEALRLREGGVTTPILNFGPFARDEAEALVRHDIAQSVFTDEVVYLAGAARALNRTAAVHVKVDTGLGRVGVPHDRALAFVATVASTPGISMAGIFTPFSEEEDFDRVQLDRFVQVCEGARQRGLDVGLRHAASSAGVISFPEAYLDMVRPGIAIYGQYPSVREYKARRIDLRPAMSLKTRVTYVKTLRPGDAVSYHRAFVAEQDTDVATISMGYSDGYPYQAAGKAEVIVQGRRWPAIALVTSNHMTLDVTGASSLEIGQEAVLFGKQGEVEISAEEVAAWAGTSVYKILIGMNPLLPKTYLGA